MGELSSERQALEGAPGTRQTLEALRDPIRPETHSLTQWWGTCRT